MQDLITFLANHPYLTAVAAVIMILLFIVEFIRAKRATFSITPIQATQKINHDNAVIIDIRSSDAYKKGHIIDAYSMNADELRKNPKKLDKFRAKPIIFVCNAGIDSQKIAPFFIKEGYNTYSVAGGMRAWMDAQMPLVKE